MKKGRTIILTLCITLCILALAITSSATEPYLEEYTDIVTAEAQTGEMLTDEAEREYVQTVMPEFQAAAQTDTAAKERIVPDNITLSEYEYQYSGSVCTPSVTVKNAAGKTMTKNVSYTVTYSDGCKLPGRYTVTVTGIGKYTGTVEKEFTVKKQELNAARITLSKDSCVYNGEMNKPAVTAKTAQGKTMTAGVSYTVTYSGDCKLPGTYTVTVKGNGNFTGTVKKTFTVKKQELNAARITLSKDSCVYNGEMNKPAVTAKTAQGKTMTAGVSYTVTYSGDCRYPGKYTVTVNGNGNFTGTVKKTFTVKKQELDAARVTLSKDSFTYDGSTHKPSVGVKTAQGKTMTEVVSYTVTYSGDGKAAGKYTVTVTGKGNFTGTVEKSFTVIKKASSGIPGSDTLEIGSTLAELTAQFGNYTRKNTVVSGIDTYVFADNYSKFFMAYIKNGKAVAYYTAAKNFICGNFTQGDTNVPGSCTLENGTTATLFTDGCDSGRLYAALIIKSGEYLSILSPSSSVLKQMSVQIFDITNAFRAQKGLSAFKHNDALDAAAREHSEDMAAKDYFSHTSLSTGYSVATRLEMHGIENWYACAENIAAGNAMSYAVVNQWVNSSGHRTNMLGSYSYLGVGGGYNSAAMYRYYWTQDFASF